MPATGSAIKKRAWNGRTLRAGEGGEYLTTRSGFLFKASYAKRFGSARDQNSYLIRPYQKAPLNPNGAYWL